MSRASFESVMEALFALAQPLVGTTLATASRRPKQPQETPLQDCPALYQIEGQFHVKYGPSQPASVWDLRVAWAVIVAQNDPTQPMSPPLNAAIDALAHALAPITGESQTLGGLVVYCAIEGPVEVFEGVLGDRAVALITIRILLPGF